MTYEIITRDDLEVGRLRGIEHGLDGSQLPNGQRVKVYEVEDRISDLFEADCEADEAVVSYRSIGNSVGRWECQ